MITVIKFLKSANYEASIISTIVVYFVVIIIIIIIYHLIN
jgi:hypothetical protein